MNEQLQADCVVAKAVVDRLIELGSGCETEAWLAKYRQVQNALAHRRPVDAVRAHGKLTYYTSRPQWIVSSQLSNLVAKAMSNLALELGLPNSGRKQISPDGLPTDLMEPDTLAEEHARYRQGSMDFWQRDPLDDNPDYAPVLHAASEQARAELKSERIWGRIGYCQVFWDRKQQILWQRYGIRWQIPAKIDAGTTYY
jgi:hypothetical protein